MAAYECVLEAKVLHHRSTREDNVRALGLIRPQSTLIRTTRTPMRGTPASSASSGSTNGAKIVPRPRLRSSGNSDRPDARPNDSDVHRILAAVYVVRNDLDRAQVHQQRALALNPNDDLIVVQEGEILTWLGQPEQGIEWIRKAMRLNPYHPQRPLVLPCARTVRR